MCVGGGSSIIISSISPFLVFVFLYIFVVFCLIFYASRIDPNRTTRYAASELGMNWARLFKTNDVVC